METIKQLRKLALVLTIALLSNSLFGQGWSVNPADYNYTGQVTAVVFHGTTEVTTGTLGAFVGGTCRGYATGTFFPLTGRTVFLVMCYSNLESGEILTFRYFDPSDGTTYEINETQPFVADMIIGNDMTPREYHTRPLLYTVTGGGSYCEGAGGLPVGLTNSETGVTYTLLRDGLSQVPTVAGTGSAISFGNRTGGTYTVTGTNSGGTVTMTGNAVIVENPLPAVPVGSPGSGAACTQITANWSTAANATTYYLDVSTVSDYSVFHPGYQNLNTGNVTSYAVTGLTAGTVYYYRVRSSNSCGTSVSSGSIAYSTSPASPATPGAITGTASQCPALTLQTYSIGTVADATTYTWTVPTGWAITGGQGTTTLSVTTGSFNQNGDITVTASNSCGTSTASSLAVTVNPGTPATPGVITGTAAQCPALTLQTYSIGAVADATTYTWTVPTGWTITGGQGTTTLTVTTGAFNQNGDITVTASNSCGTSAASSLAVTVNPGTPATPGVITGTAAQCPALTLQTYSIGAVTNATSYTWTVPAGWTITGGQGTTTLTVTTGAYNQNGNITVTASNSCGTSAASSLAVTVNPGTPATPGVITGTSAQCPALTLQTYSIGAVTNATSYTWTVPTGWTITGGQGTTTLTVTTGAYNQNGNITVTASNSCGTSAASSLAVTVNPGTPATPGVITGTAAQCPALTLQTYSIGAVTNATSYTWTVPTGWTITGGQGTTTLTVTTGAFNQNGNITVTASNSCGTSAASSLAVTVNPGTPATPGVITGTAAQCPALTLQTYNIGAVTDATSYTWTVPTGWTITGGQGTTTLTVTTGAYNQNGNIAVTAGNSCGTSTARTLAVIVNPGAPSQPGVITGTAAQCPALTLQTYSIGAVTDATSYTWTVPTGWTITGGQGTTTLTVTTGAFNQNGNITVTASNSCGTSAASSLAVTVNPGTPATPGVITGTAAQCPALTLQTYSIGAVTNATSYTWTVPTGWTITGGQGTTTLTVTTGAFNQNGNITVTASNSCGTSAASSLAVTVNPGTPATPGVITGTSAQCPALTLQTYSIGAVTNATSYTWTVPTGWAITGGQGTTTLTVTTGAFNQNGNITVTASNSCGTSAASSLAVTVNPGTPATPGVITGTSAQCPALTLQTYSIGAVTNATSYTWTVPTGWTITGGQGTTTLTVTTGAFNQNGNITVTASNSCGTSAASSLAVTVNPGTPATPGVITGTAAQCPALTLQTYSIGAVTNATSYTWTVPTGWTITGGQGTTTLTVTTGAFNQNGNITVTASNSCGTSAASSLAVIVNPGAPSQPGVITGTAAQCPALTLQTYSIASVTNATSYTWTVPAGWAITGGQGTTTLTVTTGAFNQNGNITVTASNSCGTSAASSLAVTVNPGTPATPGVITGTAAQCPALTLQTYSIGAVTNATSYTWTVPTGWTITGGQGTTTLTVTTGAFNQNGNITVTASNSCGTSAASSLAVTVNPGTPAQPGTITGTAIQCPGIAGQNYSIGLVPNATNYTWSVPTGWSITGGQGTVSIAVTTGSAGQGGNISVIASNSCGTGLARTLPVIVNSIPTINGIMTVCMGSTTQLSGSGSPSAVNPWLSSATSVATVSSAGLVTPVAPGSSIITYTDSYGCSNTVTVIVNALPVISGTLSIYLGSTTQLTGNGTPAVASPWVSSVPSIATVSNTGLVTSVNGGTTLITYTNSNGCSSSVTVTINLVTYSRSLASGWNWFSVNTLLPIMSLTNVLPGVTSNGDYIKNQVNSATYYTGYGWFGSLVAIEPTTLYKIRVQNGVLINYSGAPVNVGLTSISLVTGWNWVGYLPQTTQSLVNCFSGYPLSNLDYIKNQTLSATYYSGYGWFGSLANLNPSEGYMVRVASSGTLNYPAAKGTSDLSEDVDNNKITFNRLDYEYNGSITAEVYIDGETTGSENSYLVAYIGNEIRGVSKGYYFSPRGSYVFPIMVYSNKKAGEIVEFRYYDATSDKTFRCRETVTFTSDMVVADAFKSATLNTVTKDDSMFPVNDELLSLRAYPNPFEQFLIIEYYLKETANVTLGIYDASGKRIEELVNAVQSGDNYSVKWNGSYLPGGLYFVKLQVGNSQKTLKVTQIR